MEDNHLRMMQGLPVSLADHVPCATCGHKHAIDHACMNGAGIPREKLHASTGRPKGARNLHAKHPSSLARRLKSAGVDWVEHLAHAIKANDRDGIALWLKLLPYLVTTTNKLKVRKWRGKASKAALVALDALEGR